MKQRCKFGNRCWNISGCRFYHSPIKNTSFQRQCRYGDKCRRKQSCKFWHTQTQKNNQFPQKLRYETKQDKKTWRHIQTDIKVENCEKQSQIYSQITNEETIRSNEIKQIKSQEISNYCQIFVAQQEYLQQKLQDFFNPRLIKNLKFDKIYNYIIDNSDPNDAQLLFQRIQKLEQDYPELISMFGYIKLVKTIIKKDFEQSLIIQQLQKQSQIKRKKEIKEQQLLNAFPYQIPYQVLDDAALIELPLNQYIFLVDGNNVLPTQKILRKYYHHFDQKINAQGQIRLKWLVSEIPNCTLYYDYQYDSQLYKKVEDKIFYTQEKSLINQQKCFFASQESEQIADDLILQTLKQIGKGRVVIVTGDRVLIQKALRINQQELKVTSGLFFIKFCKQFIRRKYFGNKIKKGMIKRIFVDPPSDSEEEASQNCQQ